MFPGNGEVLRHSTSFAIHHSQSSSSSSPQERRSKNIVTLTQNTQRTHILFRLGNYLRRKSQYTHEPKRQVGFKPAWYIGCLKLKSRARDVGFLGFPQPAHSFHTDAGMVPQNHVPSFVIHLLPNILSFTVTGYTMVLAVRHRLSPRKPALDPIPIYVGLLEQECVM